MENESLMTNPIKKWAKNLNRRFSKAANIQNHDKRLNIINHYRKANQNHNEIPLYTHYDMIKRWITASVGICGDIGTPAHCWWEYIKWCSYYKNSLAVSQNVKCKGTA